MILGDLEPEGYNIFTKMYPEVKVSSESVILGQEDSACNYDKGHYTIGKEICDPLIERVRKEVEMSDNPQGFVMHSSLSGGTGSGVMTLILERMHVYFPKKLIVSNLIYPSNTNDSTSVVENYNAVRSTGSLMEHSNMVIMNTNAGISNYL